MFTNAVLAISVMNLDGLHLTGNTEDGTKHLANKQSNYFNVILFSTLGLSLVKFIGVGFFVSRLTPRGTEKIYKAVYYFLTRNLLKIFQRT